MWDRLERKFLGGRRPVARSSTPATDDWARLEYVDALLRELDGERPARIMARIHAPHDWRTRWDVPSSRLFLAIGIDLTAAGLLATLVVPTAELFVSVVLGLDFLAVVAVAAAIFLLPLKPEPGPRRASSLKSGRRALVAWISRRSP